VGHELVETREVEAGQRHRIAPDCSRRHLAEEPRERADEFDSGPEFLEVVGGWRGTLFPASIAERAAAARQPVRVVQDVRLRLLRALG
jgi:hypothetical protein